MNIFPIKSHFLSIYNNVIIKQQIKYGTIQNVLQKFTCIMVFFIPFTCITLYLFYRSPLLRYAIKITNNGMREKKIFCMYNYFHVSRYIKGGRKSHYVHNRIFRHTCVYKQTILTKYRLGSTTGSRKKVNI